MHITVRAEAHATEDPERVRRAVLNIFPDAKEAGESWTVQELQTLSTRIAEQAIRDTARNILLRSVRGNMLIFHLNKQAAYAGRVNFTEGNAVLGDIEVRIETEEAEAIAKFIAEG